jgi:hypothetical protein
MHNYNLNICYLNLYVKQNQKLAALFQGIYPYCNNDIKMIFITYKQFIHKRPMTFNSQHIDIDRNATEFPMGPGIASIRLINAIMQKNLTETLKALDDIFWSQECTTRSTVKWEHLKKAAELGCADICRALINWGAKPSAEDVIELRKEFASYPEAANRIFAILKNAGLKEIDQIHAVKVISTFVLTKADYHNSFGLYVCDENNNISQIKLVFLNTQDCRPNQSLEKYFYLLPNERLGAFIISDGARKNPHSDLVSHKFNFASSPDRGSLRNLVKQADTLLKGDCFHLYPKLNADNCDHVIIKDCTDNTIRMGFEDMWDNGDKSFTDVVVDLQVFRSEIGLLTAQQKNQPTIKSNPLPIRKLIARN